MIKHNVKTLQGYLEVTWHKGPESPSFRASHELNVEEDKITYYLLSNLKSHTHQLKNNVAEWLYPAYEPTKYSAIDVKKETDFQNKNFRKCLVAYFPADDFKKDVEIEKRKLPGAYARLIKTVPKKIFSDATAKLRLKKYSIVSDMEYNIAKNEIHQIKSGVESLAGLLDIVTDAYDDPYVIILQGVGISEGSDNNDVESILLGDKETTEKLVDELKCGVGTASQVLAGLFHPHASGVEYHCSKNPGGIHNDSRFLNGTYNPFKNMEELQIFDYRER